MTRRDRFTIQAGFLSWSLGSFVCSNPIKLLLGSKDFVIKLFYLKILKSTPEVDADEGRIKV